MTRGAVLVSGDGGQLQAILDSIFFKEISDLELIAVISSNRDAYAMRRAAAANIPAYVVDPELFPNATSHSVAVATKLKDMDIDLVILADYDRPLGVIPVQFKGQIIGSVPYLYPAYEGCDSKNVCASVLKRGVKVTGATAYFCDNDGGIGGIIEQKAIEVSPDDTPDSLRKRIMEECEWVILPKAVQQYCSGLISVEGSKIRFVKTVENEKSEYETLSSDNT